MTEEDKIKLMLRLGYTISGDETGIIVLNPKGKKVTPCDDGKGYYRFRIPDGRRRPNGKLMYKNVPLHRIVAYVKFGDVIFEPGIVVMHKDDDPTNCNWDNIDKGTFSENNKNQKRSKPDIYSDEEILKFMKFISNNESLTNKEISEKLKLKNPRQIRTIKDRYKKMMES